MVKTWQVLLVASLGVMLGLDCGSSDRQLHRGAPATITFHIVDSYGTPVKYRVETFHDVENPTLELAGQFEGLSFKNAVQGKIYEFRLAPLPQSKEFPAFKERIIAGEASTLAFFAVPESVYLPDSVAPYPVTQFTIKPMPHGADSMWVTVRAAFLPQVYDLGPETVRVSPDGTFALHGLHGGRYVVTLCRDNKVVGLTSVDIPLLGPPKSLIVTF